MTAPKHPSEWKKLFSMACSMIEQVNERHNIIDSWTFGGGTAMMIQMDHRESHDVDIFISDPQILPFLNPSVFDFDFEIAPSGYVGDGVRSSKIYFEGMGEIDFIVASSLTKDPYVRKNIDGREVYLERIPEIITKKVFYRGANIKPRDIFDIAVGGILFMDEIISELRNYRDRVEGALDMLGKMNPEFVSRTISDLMIKEEFYDIAKNAQERSTKILKMI